MKHINYISGVILLASTIMVSCVDDSKLLFDVEKPASIASMEYLNDYDFLKSYVDRTANPNFKLGAAVSAKDYSSQELLFRLANANFDEITAGNEMKHASCVADDGTMDFKSALSLINSAEVGGVSVFGHTLAWHAQQNNKYLNKLIADKIDKDYVPTKIEKKITENRTCIVVHAGDMVEAGWDTQFWIASKTEFKEGDKWKISMLVRADKDAKATTQVHKNAGEYLFYVGVGDVNFTREWKTYEAEGTFSKDQNGGKTIAFNLNEFAGANNYYYDDIVFQINGKDVISNGSFSDNTDNSSYFSKEKRGAVVPSTIVDKIEYIGLVDAPIIRQIEENRTCIVVHASDMVEAAWDTQFWIQSDATFKEGDSWSISMSVRADKNASSGTQTHLGAGGYKHWAAIGTVNFTPTWETYKADGKMTKEQDGSNAIAFNLNDFASANNYYFDDLSFKINGKEVIKNGSFDGSDNHNYFVKEGRGATVNAVIVDKIKYSVIKESATIPQTPEEKKDTLTTALNKWIYGIMEATSAKVKAWDVVNEPISGVDNDGDGFYDLWSAKNVDPKEAKNNFYWQDYLGNLDYVRLAVAAARKGFADAKGSPTDLKLFINDYNLESGWDDNKKLKSLIHWIKKWEEDGKTKIDGIGSQMHISFNANAEKQKSQEQAIINMFNLLKESSKLVKISELDMGYVDANGNELETKELTEEQHKAMSKFYTFILKKYFEIIPAQQRYGITHWSIIDSPADGWRANQPTGLWNSEKYRKHTYAGFADGLSNK